MKIDVFGQDVTLDDETALKAWNETQLGFVSHAGATPKHLACVLEQAPDFALGLATKGLFCMLGGQRELVDTARSAFQEAKAATRGTRITARESAYLIALEHWLNGSLSRATQTLDAQLAKTPTDTLAAKMVHAMRFLVGDAIGMRTSVEKVLSAYSESDRGIGYLEGCYAFALEETGCYQQAERVGRCAMTRNENDAWGLHAVSHVHEMTVNHKAGLAWLDAREQSWAHCTNFRYHVWWHKALLHLDLGQIDAVFDLYDTEIRRDKTDDYRDIANATSLLSRLEAEGIDIADRWEELADLAEARSQDGASVFADLHYMLALVGGKRSFAVSKLIKRMEADSTNRKTELERLMGQPGLSAASGLNALGEGRPSEAFAHLCHARRDIEFIGGSRAQRDVFERLTIDAGIRAGLFEDAQAILMERTQRRAGREDGYTAARMAMISDGLRDAQQLIA